MVGGRFYLCTANFRQNWTNAKTEAHAKVLRDFVYLLHQLASIPVPSEKSMGIVNESIIG